jgi:hypothetical protein
VGKKHSPILFAMIQAAALYNRRMARGWESKSVEGQVQEAESKEDRKPSRSLSPEEAEKQRRRSVLQLSRVQVERQIENAPEGRYREQLTRALVDLDTQLKNLK